MNAWEQLNRDDPENQPGNERRDGDSLDRNDDGPSDLGAEDARVSRIHEDEVIDAEEAPQKPKKNLKPLLFGMGAFVLLLVGGMVYVVMSLLSTPNTSAGYAQSAEPSHQLAPAAVRAGQAESVNLFADSAASAASQDPLAQGGAPVDAGAVPGNVNLSTAATMDAPTAPAADSLAQGAPAAPTGAEGATGAAAQVGQVARAAGAAALAGQTPQVQAAASPSSEEQRAALEKRLAGMESDIAEIKRKLDELAKAPRAAQASTKPARTATRQQATAAKPREATRQRTATASKSEEAAASAPTPAATAAAAAAPTGVEGLSLRAVNPPHGPDMQAWVMDGDRIMVVTRGSTIRGARVTSIELDRVVTDRGVIR